MESACWASCSLPRLVWSTSWMRTRTAPQLQSIYQDVTWPGPFPSGRINSWLGRPSWAPTFVAWIRHFLLSILQLACRRFASFLLFATSFWAGKMNNLSPSLHPRKRLLSTCDGWRIWSSWPSVNTVCLEWWLRRWLRLGMIHTRIFTSSRWSLLSNKEKQKYTLIIIYDHGCIQITI